MSGMRRVDGTFSSKSKYIQQQEITEELLDLEQDLLDEEIIKVQEEKNIENKTEIKKEKFVNEEKIPEEEGKNEEEIKINQNEFYEVLKELEDINSDSNQDDEHSSQNEGIIIKF